MINFNTTFVLSAQDVQAVIDYLRGEYVPYIVANSPLTEPSLMRIDPQEGAEEAVSLALALRAECRSDLELALEGAVGQAQRKLYEFFGERVLCFATTMEYIPLREPRARS